MPTKLKVYKKKVKFDQPNKYLSYVLNNISLADPKQKLKKLDKQLKVSFKKWEIKHEKDLRMYKYSQLILITPPNSTDSILVSSNLLISSMTL